MVTRVLVCGGRAYTDRGKVFEVLDGLHHKHGALIIIEGGAAGADTLADEWTCMQRTCRLITEPADRKRHGRPAGPIRNQKMLDNHKPELVVGFPGGRGTAHMMRIAREAGIEVIEVSHQMKG